MNFLYLKSIIEKMPIITILDTATEVHQFRIINDPIERVDYVINDIHGNALFKARQRGNIKLYKNKEPLITIENVYQFPVLDENYISVVLLVELGYEFKITGETWTLTHSSDDHPNLDGYVKDKRCILEHDIII